LASIRPDGRRLAIAIEGVGGSELWVYDLEREIPTKLPTAGHVILGPVWAPDGKHLIYGSVPSGWIRADGGGEPQQLTRDDTHIGQVPTSVSPDGFVLITKPGAAKEQSLTIDATDPDHPKAGATEPLLNESGSIIGSTISPDGRWLRHTRLALPVRCRFS